ncbi:MAG: hypothetical protein E7208_02055 [Clostridium butyricum]|nr:hypothetical protein [Clostridium butyricum]
MKENWYALLICLETNTSVDTALRKMNVCFKGASKVINKKVRCKYSDELIKRVFELKELGNTHKQIGLTLGLTADQISGIVRLHKEKATKNPNQSILSSTHKTMRKNSTSLYHSLEASQ